MRQFVSTLGRLGIVLLLVLGGCGRAQDQVRSLTILHVNDLHAHFLPDARGRGGFAELATAIRREKTGSTGVLVLNAGDLVQGTPVSTIYEGLPCYEVTNEMGFDVNTLGNHEFDYGWRKIPEFVKIARYPTVSANVVDAQGKLLAPQAYVVREVNGLRVAIIGALTATLDQITKESARGPWKVLPVAATVRAYARQLRPQADLVVVLGHLTTEEEDAVLTEVPEVDVLVSGHNHAGLREMKEVDGRLAVRVQSYGVELGRLDLEVDVRAKRIASHQWRRIPVTAKAYPPDPAVARLVKAWEQKVSTLVDVPIGTAQREIRQPELKVMIEEAMQEAVGADLAYQNVTGVRDILPRGTILARHAWNVMPFDNKIVYGRLKGRELPPEVKRSHQIDPNRDYIFATNDFLADQWKSVGFNLRSEGPLVREVLIDWIKRRKRLP